MNDHSKRNSQTESDIESLQWQGCYFGSRGAVALAEQYYSKFEKADTQTRFWACMSLASVYYSAASSAMAMFRHIKMLSKFNVYGMIKWVWVSYSLLNKAWTHAQTANFMMHEDKKLQVSSSDLDVLQSIARKYYRTLLWGKPHGYKAKVVLGMATHSITKALRMSDCTNISRCLLLIGRADLLYLQIEPRNEAKLRIAMFDTLLEAWHTAMDMTVTDMDLVTKRQMARVFRHIKEMCERLIPFHKEVMPQEYASYPSSAQEMMNQASHLLCQYLDTCESEDQKLKAGIALRLPPRVST